LEEHLGKHEWLALDRPTIGDIAVMPYVALSPMGNIDLSVYPSVQAWIARIRNLPGAISMPGLDDPDYYKKQRSA
jgi:glutathione S-transferase